MPQKAFMKRPAAVVSAPAPSPRKSAKVSKDVRKPSDVSPMLATPSTSSHSPKNPTSVSPKASKWQSPVKEAQQSSPVKIVEEVHDSESDVDDEVSVALLSADGFPVPCRKMLRKMLRGSLNVPQDKRHRHQERIVEMVGHVLDCTEARLHKTVDELEAVIARHDTERKSREAALADADSRLAEADLRVADAVALHKQRQASVLEAAATLSKAKDVQDLAQADLTAAQGKKSRLVTAERDAYGTLKEKAASGSEGQALLDSLVATAKECGFDPSLVDALPNALTMAPIARSAFYSHINPQIEAEFPKHLTIANAALASAQVRHTVCLADVQTAQAAHDVVFKTASATEIARAEVSRARKEVDVTRTTVQQAVLSCPAPGPDILAALPPARRKLEEFLAGPSSKFKSLRTRQSESTKLASADPALISKPVGTDAIRLAPSAAAGC